MAKEIFTKSKDMSAEYCCTIVRIGEIVPIENSDFLATTELNGRTIVVRKDQVKEGDVMFYASNETQINGGFLYANSLYDDKSLNADTERKGYFNKYGRVRMVKLRGVVSMGYIFSLEELKNFIPVDITEAELEKLVDTDFDEVDGKLFIKAYVPPMPSNGHGSRGEGKRNKKLKKFNRMIDGQFSYHYDTAQLERNMHRIQPTDSLAISVKEHGCVERNTIVNTMEFGNLSIGEIVEKKLECHIKAFDTNSEENVYVPIDNFYMIPNDGEWYEIELEDGKTITITGNNPVWLPDLKCYRRVDELNGDEMLLVD